MAKQTTVNGGLRVGSLNICRGLYSKEKQLKMTIQDMELDIVFLLETDVSDLDLKNPPSYEGYNTICPQKNSNNKTRILAFVKQALNAKKRDDLMCKEISSIWIEVTSDIKEKFLIGGLYREFDDLEGMSDSKSMAMQSQRQDKFRQQVERAENEKCTIIGIGDMNLDMEKWHKPDYKFKRISKNYQEMLSRLGLHLFNYGYTFQRINKEGKVTRSAIDHAFTNREGNIKKTEKQVCSFSDHDMIIIEAKINKREKKPKLKQRTRDLKRIRNNPDIFKNALSMIEWGKLALCTDVDEQVDFYTARIKNVLDTFAPFKEKIIRRRPKIVFSKETSAEVNIRNKLKLEIDKIKEGECDAELKKEYSKQKNKCKRMIHKEQMEVINKRIRENGVKEAWKVVNNTTKPKEEESKMQINVEGRMTSDDQEIANAFNAFYIDKVQKLSDGIDKQKAVHPTAYLEEENRDANVPKLVFKPVQETFVRKLIKELKSKTSFGRDGISAELLKMGGDILCVPLTYIINRSIVTNKFPSQWKEAIIKPLFKKKGTKEEMQYYRPVALLCVSGMILERVITLQLEAHLERHNLLGQFQFGYRKKRSTVTAVVTMSSNAEAESAKGKIVGMTMFDMSAAFDTVKKETLCKKIGHLGISTGGKEWISSYMTERKQRVKVGDKQSEVMDITLGTPQGSRLSPLLFNIMMCDLNLYLKNGLQCNFADDTANEVTGENMESVLNKLQEDAEKMIEFTSSNNLCINSDKTAFICSKKDVPNLKIGPHYVEAEDHTELLGMTISGDLTWSRHAEETKKKLRQRIGILRRLKYNIPQSTMRIIAEALFTSKLRSGIALYCKPRLSKSAPKNKLLKELTVIQNDMMRAITMTKHGKRRSIKSLREKTKTTSVNHLCCYHILTEVFSIFSHNTSGRVKELLQKKPGTGNMVTRSKASGLTKIPMNRGSKNGFLFYAASLWNMLPQTLRSLASNEEVFADAASSVPMKDEKQIQRQDKHKEMRARDFKKQIKVWIRDKIPEG